MRLIIFLLLLFTAVRSAFADEPDRCSIDADMNPEAKRFIEKVRALNTPSERMLFPFDGDHNPWIPYLTIPFDEGLNDDQRKMYLFFQSGHYCWDAKHFEHLGFLALYPQLEPVLTDPLAGTQFHTVLSKLGRGFERCSNLWDINETIKKTTAKADDPSSAVAKIGKFVRNREESIENPIHQHMIVAMCADYAPAIADMLRFDRVHGDVLSLYERAYLQARAFHHGLLPYRSTGSAHAARELVPEPYRIEFDAVSYRANPQDFDHLLPLWHTRCMKTEYWRFAQGRKQSR